MERFILDNVYPTNMDIRPLKEAGLTEGEIKVYLSLLELGSTTTGPIIEESGVARSIIYNILDRLMDKGLVSCITKEKTKYFQAAQPNKILEYIDEKESRIEENRKKVEEILPQLLLKQSMAKKSEANMYFGFRGIRTCHEHYLQKLKKCEEYCYLGVPADQPKEQHIYWKKDHVRRSKEGIRCRLLFNKGTDHEVLRNRNSYKGADARYMKTDIQTPAGFLTYKDTVMIMLQSPTPIAVEIVNQEIKDSFQAYFEEFWKRSKPFKG